LDYWAPKLQANKDRDAKKADQLAAQGWDVLTVWQCEIRDEGVLRAVLLDFLNRPMKKSQRSEESVVP
jgi:DNA mismatch endonuclease (patch repair protein)